MKRGFLGSVGLAVISRLCSGRIQDEWWNFK